MKILHIIASYKPAYIYGGPIMSVAKLCECLGTSFSDFRFSSINYKSTNNEEQTTGNVQLTTNNEHLTTNNEQRASNNEHLTTNNEQRASNNEQRTTNNEQLTTNNYITVYTTLANGEEELPYPSGTVRNVDGVEVHYFKRLTKDHSHFSPALYWKLWKTAKDFDIIHIHAWWNLVSIFSLFIALLKGKPVVLTPRGTLSGYSFNNRTSSPKKLFHRWIGAPLLNACYIHTTSKREEMDMLKLLQAKHVKTIPNLVELPWQEAQSLLAQHQAFNGTLKLIFLSRVEQKKGLELLFDILAKADFPYHLEIAGTGDESYLLELKALSKSLGIAEHISWLGMLHKDEKFIQLAKNDLFVLPSYDENFANVVIESLFAGTPVWITENVGLSDYVNENNLGWVAKRDLSELAKQLQEAYLSIAQQNINRSYLQQTICRDFKEDNLIAWYEQMYIELSNLNI